MVATPPLAQSRPDMPVSFVIELGARDNYGDRDRRCRSGVVGRRPVMDAELVSTCRCRAYPLDDSGTTALVVTVTPQIARDTTVTITLSDPVTGLVLPQSVEQKVIATADRVLSAL